MIERMFVKVSMPSYESFGAAPTFRTSIRSDTATPATNANTIANPMPVRRLRVVMCRNRYTRPGPKKKPPNGTSGRLRSASRRRSGQERLDPCDLARRGPVAGPDHALHHPPLAVEEEALRKAPDAVLPAHLALRVEQH